MHTFPSLIARNPLHENSKKSAECVKRLKMAAWSSKAGQRTRQFVLIRAPQILRPIAAALLVLSATTPMAQAAGEISIVDLRAATRALGFLDSLPRDGTIAVGIVYAPQVSESKALAAQAAGWLAGIPAPNKAVFRTRIIPLDTLVQASDRLDVIFLMPGLTSDSAAIVDAMRRRHLISISTDPACLDANCCVLMVRADHGVEIVLHTAMAQAVGASFSTVFTMMVKRR